MADGAHTDQPAGNPSANYLVQLWRGQVALAVTFWLWGVGVNVLLTVFFAYGVRPGRIVGLLDRAYVVFGVGVNALLTLFFTYAVTPGRIAGLLYLVYYLFMVVAIWRSSERYRGPKVWGALARISVILGVIRTAFAIWLLQAFAVLAPAR